MQLTCRRACGGFAESKVSVTYSWFQTRFNTMGDKKQNMNVLRDVPCTAEPNNAVLSCLRQLLYRTLYSCVHRETHTALTFANADGMSSAVACPFPWSASPSFCSTAPTEH
jgi:hypothetical protein